MKLRHFLAVFTTIYLISQPLFSKTEYLKCDSLIFKIKNPVLGFNKAFINIESKWIKIKNFELLENKYVLYGINSNQKKCFNKGCKVDIKIKKDNNNSKFYEYISVVSNEFCSIDGSNKCFKRDIGKNLQKGYCNLINYEK